MEQRARGKVCFPALKEIEGLIKFFHDYLDSTLLVRS